MDKRETEKLKTNNGRGKQPASTEETTDKDGQDDKGMSTKKKILFGVLAILVIAGLIYGWNWYQFARVHESTDNAQIEGHISPVIPRVAGYAERIYVDDNEKVHKGQLLVSIDKDNFKIGVQQAQSDLASAKAGYQDAQARLETARARQHQAQVGLQQARTEKNRQQRLLNDHSATQQNYDNAKYAFQSAQAKYRVAQRQVKAARTNIQSAQAQIKKAQSGLKHAKLQLSYTELRAPIEGRVSKKDVEAGQYIRPGNPVMAIARDDSIWVVANFKEGQIAQINVGQPVSIKVDAYSDTTFQGRVQSLAGATGSKFALLPPDNASGNFVKVEQRIPVKIVFTGRQDPNKPLKPGMNVEPTVNIKKQ